MRSYSIFTILLLCLVILGVDILAFYWLQSITKLLPSFFEVLIHILFWFFTLGLISAILTLKVTLDDIPPKRKHVLISSLYGLTVASFIPKIIFVVVISILFFTNYVFSEQASVLIIPLIGLLSGVIPFFAVLYAIFKAVHRFKIHHHKIRFNKLPIVFKGLKIVHISDLHLGSFNYRYKILNPAIKLINNLHPDLIFFTGDIVNNYAWELVGWEHVFNKLKANIGKYAILGNHDYGDYSNWKSGEEKFINFIKIKQFYKDIGFSLLLNDSDTIERNNEKIAIIGVENWGKPPFNTYGDIAVALRNCNNIPFKILLSHDPTFWEEMVVKETNISLTLSGHTHGMQLGFQFKNFKWSPVKYKYKHWAGLYEKNNQFLYVNRGLGWLGFPGRLGMRPEITYLELN
ncbi:metallophosphoesterase [Seonamhaeicola sediminis]|uniref:Metallophosphoesterase n=1 Tax=Seonamhaeicola sediminis TaxID=2528206 RepID=A0A562YE52_9FLAO|nr:metallophosphoesterase [Seonamhaeicola sediminis]TWO32908.1 metallophosphoesterase [Seonamhaeicola sediminis]